MTVYDRRENGDLDGFSASRKFCSDIGIVGYAARLPCADDVDSFWEGLLAGQSAIGTVPEDRWNSQKFSGAGAPIPGRTISRKAGVLADIWSFDAQRFNISPREARQMDPQQRILLEVVAAAFDHAGLNPDCLDKDRTGVFVGASAADHSMVALQDPTEVEPHFMLGNTLSLIANRISFTWDLRGPSVTVDTACSSSLVAFDQACNALREGRIDTALVAGVSILLSPIPFVGFSQAGMLSPKGLCRPFAEGADGYVRSEGAVVFVLQRRDLADELGLRVRSVVAGSGVNTVGRGPGITVPSSERQADLIRSVIARSGVNLDDIVYLEAHGTGTAVGDPIEAQAIGDAVKGRQGPNLAFGSVKSNIGHLEPASGLAGLLKAQLVLEKGQIPPTIHAETLNPAIDFDQLKIELVRDLRDLPGTGRERVVGVNSFGFGGVNAHVLIREVAVEQRAEDPEMPAALLITAPTESGLRQQVETWGRLLSASDQVSPLGQLVANANWNRARHRERLCLAAGSPATLSDQIDLWLSGKHVDTTSCEALGVDLPVVFVFSGNGAVWPGMARDNYSDDAIFRGAFDALSDMSIALGGPDLVAALASDDLAQRLTDGELAQPLNFAIQVALCRSLASFGMRPAACLGHSLGEVAAAVVAGRISDTAGMNLVVSRARILAPLRDTGTMAAFTEGRDKIAALIAANQIDAEVSAENAPAQVTVSGTASQLDALVKAARRSRIAGKVLDIPYPYHSRGIRSVEGDLRSALQAIGITESQATVRFYSGCFGRDWDDGQLEAEYWTQNTLRPVEFRSAVESACRDGFRLFLEITPKTVIGGYIRMILDDLAISGRVLETLDPRKAAQRSAAGIARRVLAVGGRVDERSLLGRRQSYGTRPPAAPFERKAFRLVPGRGPDIFGRAETHPLLGALTETGAHRWRASLSLELLPWLAQHRVAGRIVLPATAMIEIMHQAARYVLPTAITPELRDVEFLRPVEVPQAGIVELQTDWEPAARRITLSQLVGGDWVPTAVSRAFSGSPMMDTVAPRTAPGGQSVPGFYEGLSAQGLDYGPLFARVDRVDLDDAGMAHATLSATPAVETACALDPAAADAGLHAAAILIGRAGVRLTGPMVPARIGRVRMAGTGQIRSADLVLRQATVEGAHLDIDLRDEMGRLLARFDEVRLRPFPEAATKVPDLWEERLFPLAGHTAFDLAGVRAALARLATAEPADVDILRAALAARVAWDVVADSLEGLEATDTDGLNLCTNWLIAQGYARFVDRGLELVGRCPWPTVDSLLPTLGQIPNVVNGEFASLLDFVTRGGLAGGKSLAPLPRLQAALQNMIATARLEGRIALVGPVGRAVIEWFSTRGHAVTLITASEETREAARAEFADFPVLRIAKLGDARLAESFDLVIGAHVAQAIPSLTLAEIVGLLAPGGCLATLEESADLFALITGRHHGAAALDTLCATLTNEGLAAEIQKTSASETIFLVSGRRDIAGSHPMQIDVVGQGAWAEVLRKLSTPEAEGSLTVVLLNEATDAFGPDLLRVLRALPESETVWLLAPGLARFEALTGWRRVLVNETGRDLRLCSVSDDADVATLLRVLTASSETEVRIDGKRATSPRVFPHAAKKPALDQSQALQLQMPSRSPVAERPVWKPVARQVPRNGEVEIAVEATGLNFRDVMWAQGLIPPEGLEGGFAGQGLGMECAGRILGNDPTGRFLPGQKVAAFAPNAFATHVTVPVHAVLPLPDELSMIEGAALPVVFLTADYALNELARLGPGETVLIHGGAGGVGLAAIQIARKAGARVLATAGSPARRGYLKMVGADATFDSRSLSFVDAVMQSTGGRGVDVVLNSLAGEALELSLSCLAPFGRFVELGKRDIFQNSTIGLRVLKNNISMMAVDVDQLLQHRPQVAERAMARVAEGFASGNLQPLPVSAFDAFETPEAFRMMLRSGQIGKIVVRPPDLAATAKASAALTFGGCWLVAGGTDGFGLATAEWLVRQGVRRLWLTSRSGRLSDAARARLLPAEVQVRAADVSDESAMALLADAIQAADGRLDGIVHSAGVLRDGLFADLDDRQILQVVTPKVRGAEVLDHITRRLKPSHFWLFSSVSARFGNIGQAPYVAANRALEAIASLRNAEGLPALAIAWGPISDVGMLQRMPERHETLARTLGTLLTAEQALDRLAKVLGDGFEGPTITIAPMEWSRLAKDLPVLGEPLFEFVPRSEIRATAGLSLSGLVAEHGETKARKEVLGSIRAEMARILRCAAAEIDPSRPMADFGFDSLMAVSLRLAIEEQLGVELSFQALGAETTLNELVHRLFARVTAPETDDLADYMQSAHVTGSPIAGDMQDRILALANERNT